MANKKGKGKAIADNTRASSVESDDGGASDTHTSQFKAARPIKLSKDAFIAMLNMAKAGTSAKELAKTRGNKLFKDMQNQAVVDDD
ncbi:unnamed protein product [Rhizoctonia solani]|uniref:Uncharacterized protein n=1 Tax=Rhizoctonia solani TaxID=456999 RepID=A0A8H3D2L6_9AGAM|nr:unnamed protein product [Rhizoctonia solani]CAE7233481.1 unnamed protein product [Rhizoctonia solani]